MNSRYCKAALLAALIGFSLTLAADEYPSVGRIHQKSEKLHELLAPDAVIEQVSEDVFVWSEGPVWIRDGSYLLFSDVPANTQYKWSESNGLEVFLQPSSFPGTDVRDPSGQGTNGLMLSLAGKLLAADHGARALVETDLTTGAQKVLTRAYLGKRFNSPNDLVPSRVRWPGTLFFTDPPYGLTGEDDSKLKELDHNGVYRLDDDGTVTLLDASLTRPNGISLSPDERHLYVANSDRNNVIWKVYNLDAQGNTDRGEIFFTAQDQIDAGAAGLPDGMAMDVEGNLWATGPGGVYVFTPEAELLGVVATGTAIANCAFGGEQGDVLYMTSDGFIARVQTRTRGVEFQ